jgi:DNA repair protein RecO (recombination protein O)
MHTILETDCFILKSTPSGEANKQLDIFTRNFGLIRATAQGVRYLKSKLRYSLTDFAAAHVSLVRGKEFWRITTASKLADGTTDLPSKEGREALYRIFALLRRLLQGEEAHPELFELVEKAFDALKQQKPAPAIEGLSVLRILYMLGYVKDDPTLRIFVDSADFSEELLALSGEMRKSIIVEINRALSASNL